MKLLNYERRIAKLQKDKIREFVIVDCIEKSMKNLNTGKIINESELKELEKTSDVLRIVNAKDQIKRDAKNKLKQL